MNVLMNPECRDGKHRNCDVRGWNLGADEACVCPCVCHRDSVAAVFENEPVDASGRAHAPAGETFGSDPDEYTSADIPTPETADFGNTSSGRFRRVMHTIRWAWGTEVTTEAVLDEETGMVARFFGDTDEEAIEMADLQARTLNGDPSLTPLYQWRPAHANGGRVEGEEEAMTGCYGYMTCARCGASNYWVGYSPQDGEPRCTNCLGRK